MSSQVTRSLPRGREPPLPGLSVPLLQGSFVPLDLALFTWGAMLKTLWLFVIKHDFWGVMHTSWFSFQWFFRTVHGVWSVDDSQNSWSWVNVRRGHQGAVSIYCYSHVLDAASTFSASEQGSFCSKMPVLSIQLSFSSLGYCLWVFVEALKIRVGYVWFWWLLLLDCLMSGMTSGYFSHPWVLAFSTI